MKLCSIPTCGKKYTANGYCAAHNAKYKKYGDPLAPPKSRWDNHEQVIRKCSNPTCDSLIPKGTYCGKCRQRKYRHGDVNIIKKTGNREIWKLAKNAGAKHKYKFDSSILNTWTPELAWLLGWTITDGCVQNKKRWVVAWMLKDLEPLEIIQKLFKTDKPIEFTYKTDKKTGKKKLYYRLRLCGKKIVQKFIELGIEPNKTFTTTVPSMPNELMWHFLRGVMEGDGHICSRSVYREDYIRLTAGINCGHSKFLEEINAIIKLGKVRQIKENQFVLEMDCSKGVEFLTKCYEDSENTRLNRKYLKWQKFIELGQVYKEK